MVAERGGAGAPDPRQAERALGFDGDTASAARSSAALGSSAAGRSRAEGASFDDTAAGALEDAVGLAFRVLQAVMVLLVIAFVGSGVETVAPHEQAFVLRLGRLLPDPLGPGAHLAWPIVDQVVRVDVGRPSRHDTEAFDLRRSATELATGRVARQGGVDPGVEGYLVTGDANLVHVVPAARVQVSDARRSLLLFSRREGLAGGPPAAPGEDPRDDALVLQVLLERACVHAAASRDVDSMLRGDKGAFTDDVRARLQASLDRLVPLGYATPGSGLTVQGVDRERDLVAAPQVREAFEAVHGASQRSDQLRSEALATASKVRGEAIAAEARVRGEARVRAERLRADAAADVAVFSAARPAWTRDRQAFMDRRVATTVAAAMRDLDEAFILGGGPLRLRLDRDMRARRRSVIREAWEREHGPPGGDRGR